jgi:hypothetical protein
MVPFSIIGKLHIFGYPSILDNFLGITRKWWSSIFVRNCTEHLNSQNLKSQKFWWARRADCRRFMNELVISSKMREFLGLSSGDFWLGDQLYWLNCSDFLESTIRRNFGICRHLNGVIRNDSFYFWIVRGLRELKIGTILMDLQYRQSKW